MSSLFIYHNGQIRLTVKDYGYSNDILKLDEIPPLEPDMKKINEVPERMLLKHNIFRKVYWTEELVVWGQIG